MTSYGVIADFCDELVRILRKGLVPDLVKNESQIGIVSPAEKGDIIVGIYVYLVNENNVNRLNDFVTISDNIRRYPPVAINLNFMITCYGNGTGPNKAIQEYGVIGRIIQILNDNKVIEKLNSEYDNLGNEILLNRLNLEVDEQIKLWSLFDEPYRLTLFYEASTLFIESEKIVETRRVKEAQFDVRRKD